MAENQDANQAYAFRVVQAFKDDSHCLGTGSYGKVYKAMCDQLLCAAKVFHPMIIQMQAPGKEHKHPLKRFEEECRFLGRINHPNIVQYLGTHCDPESNELVLLMELMDESLTHFLESSQGDLPYHIQVNFSCDIAQALAFLHSNGIIHRHLSSNNILLLASIRAKVTDFGMSKFININAMQGAILTFSPGNQLYMSPEALDESPKYTEKLDNFSFGVLLVQITTRQLPKPTDRFETKEIPDPRFPNQIARAKFPVPELKRRQAHIDLIPSDHPLLPTALYCLNDNESERPTATQLSKTLIDLKRTEKYQESSQQDQLLFRKKDEQLLEKNKQLLEKDEKLHENEEKLREKEEKILGYREILEKKLVELLAKCDTINDLQTTCKKNDQLITILQQITQQRDREMSELRQALANKSEQLLTTQTPQVISQDERQAPSTKLVTIRRWWPLPNIPATTIKHGSSAAIGDQAYFKFDDDKIVYAFSNLTYTWNKLPVPCPKNFRSIVNINYKLTAVGSKGLQSSGGKTYSYDHGLWEENFIPMLNKRSNPAVVYANNMLVVAGGHIGNTLSTSVDILNTTNRQWSNVSSLPAAMNSPSVTICKGHLYVHPQKVSDDQEKNSVYKCSLEQLVQSQPSSVIWEKITSLPVSNSSLVTVNDHLLAVGGMEANNHATTNIYEYINRLWTSVGKMTSPQPAPFTAVFPGNKLMVVGASTKCELADII